MLDHLALLAALGPVKLAVTVDVLAVRGVPEHFVVQGVVGLLLELQGGRHHEQRSKRGREAMAQFLILQSALYDADPHVLLLLRLRRRVEVLPGQHPLQEVDEHIRARLNVIPAAQLDPVVGVDAGIPGGANDAPSYPLFVGDVLGSLGRPVPLRKAEVNEVHLSVLLAKADQEVGWLDVPVDEAVAVQVLNYVQHLVPELKHRLQAELAANKSMEVLQRGP
mmetsp:Transcript_55915/g.173207  ORF Transcript_55915/g.173207 Transcript_55915/m.173207 type:complete len:222 (+) Transcript_55915:665-1330(+)